jgi:NSS family neurotransmitter:Na+ symporter
MDSGALVGAVFFLLLCVAAITSIVGLAEPVAGYVQERLEVSRRRATVFTFGALLPCSMVSALSFSSWAGVSMFGQSLDYWIEYLPNQVMLPVGGLLIAVYVAWRLPKQMSCEELGITNPIGFSLWWTLMRFIVVPAVLIILLTGL